jgi:type I restriction enzyme M protein
LWLLSRRKEGRLDKVLFIDARNLGYLINRRTRDFTNEDIAKVAETYHHWHASTLLSAGNKNDKYEDIPGFYKSVSLAEIREKDYVLTPGRYIGLPEDEDDFDFVERFTTLKAELEEQMKEEIRLNQVIIKNLKKIEIMP